jgi:hypothetical protein
LLYHVPASSPFGVSRRGHTEDLEDVRDRERARKRESEVERKRGVGG